MDEDTLAFLEKWVEDNAVGIAAHLRAEKAENLAAQCLKGGAEAGYSEEEIEEAAAELTDGEDLLTYIEMALETADEEEAWDDDDAA
jgi:hypothetical protein